MRVLVHDTTVLFKLEKNNWELFLFILVKLCGRLLLWVTLGQSTKVHIGYKCPAYLVESCFLHGDIINSSKFRRETGIIDD